MLKLSSWLNISLIFSLTGFGLCGIARANSNNDSPVPENLQVPTGQRMTLKAEGRGSQIYVCGPVEGTEELQYEWTLKAPDAKLFDAQGKVLGKHYDGPTWEANDGSKVTAGIEAKESAPNGSISWYLLKVESSQGDGMLANVKWIQRLHTTGGNPPTQDCDRDRQNTEISVNYTADYYFYSPTAGEN
jgi:hypothetical protein